MAHGETYEQFIAKFDKNHVKNSDDCYTPEAIYNAIRDWVLAEWPEYADAPIIRPFYPGGDYENHEYPDGCIVIDNPPFSIGASIRRFYIKRGIPYFLFIPGKTALSVHVDDTIIITASNITYANGAKINTAFATNLPGPKIRTAPDLADIIKAAADTPPPSRNPSPLSQRGPHLLHTRAPHQGRREHRAQRQPCRLHATA